MWARENTVAIFFAFLLGVLLIAFALISWLMPPSSRVDVERLDTETEFQKNGFRIIQEEKDRFFVSIAWRDPEGFVKAVTNAVKEVEKKSGRKVSQIDNGKLSVDFVFYLDETE